MKQEFDAIRLEMENLKSESARRSSAGRHVDSGGGKLGGFIPWKSMTPKNFGAKEEQWREWVDEVRDYMDVIKPGMKDILIKAEKLRDTVTVDAAWATTENPE